MQASAFSPLARFQDAFARALLAPDAAPPAEVAALAAQPAFAVYRNTVMKGCIDALQANYPAVARLVGDEWFRAAAAVYARETPPADPVLLHYGAAFPDFLSRFEPARDLPYLAAVAQLDRLWTEAHAAAEGEPLDASAVPRGATDLANARLRPHAAARWAWFESAPAYTIWSRNRAGHDDDGGDLEWRPEGALLTRRRDAIEWMPLDAAGCVFLDACAAGNTLAAAAKAALERQPDADMARLLSGLLAAGAFGDTCHCREEGR
jgi:hypothetical protein